MSEGSGPVSELSTDVSTGSRPVYERGRSVRESSVPKWSSGSVRESSVAPVRSGTFSEISAGTVTSNRSLRSEKLQPRLAPAPPRLGWEQTIPEAVYWEPVYELEDFVDELAAIEPLEQGDMEGFESQAVVEESAAADSSEYPDPNSAPDSGVSE